MFRPLCFPENVDVPTHQSAPSTTLIEGLGDLKGSHYLSLVLYRLPRKRTLNVAQISRIFLVKLWSVCEESVAWKRRSGKSVVIPRQKWQPLVTGRLLSQVGLELLTSAQMGVWSRTLPCLPAGNSS